MMHYEKYIPRSRIIGAQASDVSLSVWLIHDIVLQYAFVRLVRIVWT